MIINYDEGLKKLEIVANDWRHKYLTIFGKITVIKTFMLSTLSHIATILPTPPVSYCKKFEKIITDFIKGEHKATAKDEAVKGKSSIVSQDVIFAPKKYNGLGLQRVATFWTSIKLSWLRRLGHDSFWKTLHIEDLKDKSLMFNPHKSNEINLQKALKNMRNPVMRQIYIALLKCRTKLIEIDPKMALFLPIYGESRTSQNNIPALSEWSLGARVIDIITTNGNFISPNSHVKNAQVQPSSLQYSALKVQFKRSFIDTYSNANKKKIMTITLLTFMEK